MDVIGADPFVLKDPNSEYYYCYSTGEGIGDHPFYLYRSIDLLHWEKRPNVLSLDKDNWGVDWFWAPAVYYNPNNRHYYFFYSARVKKELVPRYFWTSVFDECCKIGVAISSSPEGPFYNMCNHPIEYYPYDPDYIDIDSITKDPFSRQAVTLDTSKAKKGVYIPSIDVDLFFDDGRIYMYYSRCCYRNNLYDPQFRKYIEESNILGVELDSSFWYDKTATMVPRIKDIEIGYSAKDPSIRQDKFHQIISYHHEPQPWENSHIDDYEKSHGKLHNRRWSEGSNTIAIDSNGKKKYLIFYSCNFFESCYYGVGYAKANTPLTQFKKSPQNPIVHQIPEKSLYSTGHGMVINKDDQPYYFFHGKKNKNDPRILYYGRLNIADENNVSVTDIRSCEMI